LTSRERVLAALRHEEPDRVPIQDVAWEHTIRRWRTEGFPADADPHSYFGYDMTYLGPDISLQLGEETLEETETCRLYRDNKGAILRSFKDHESTPETVDFTIKSAEDWEQYKPRLQWNEARVHWDSMLATNRAVRDSGQFICYMAHIGYDWIQRMVGAETVLVALMQQPDWIRDMVETLADLVIRGHQEMAARGCEFDGAFMANDLGYRNGTFFSPAKFREVEWPAHKRLCDYLHERGLPVILHSCGNVSEFVPMLIEAGFSCLQPLEVKAGMDLVALKRQYGDRLSFMGGIDTRAMADPDPAAIEREIATKLPVAKAGGGYIYHSDHSIPSSVSFAQYCRVMELVAEHGRYS